MVLVLAQKNMGNIFLPFSQLSKLSMAIYSYSVVMLTKKKGRGDLEDNFQ